VSESEELEYEGIVAGTGKLTGRSFRLGRQALEKAREQLLRQEVTHLIDHDSDQEIRVRNLAAEVRQASDGEYQLWVRWAVPAGYAEKIGERRGMSIAFTEREDVPWPEPGNPVIQVAPDAYHWDDGAIAEVLQQMTSHGISVEGARLHQLAGEPPAKIIRNPSKSCAVKSTKLRKVQQSNLSSVLVFTALGSSRTTLRVRQR
jgi:hypothetical protein